MKNSKSELIGVCCVCNQVRVDDKKDKWAYVGLKEYEELFKKRNVTHSYCPVCYKGALKDIEDI